MANPLLTVNYIAQGAIPVNRLVKHGTTDTQVMPATGGTDFIIGVVNELSIAAGERADVVHVGIAWVEAGAAIAPGAPITSDGLGRAITAAPGVGANVRLAGFALETATAAGDVIRYLIAPSVMQG